MTPEEQFSDDQDEEEIIKDDDSTGASQEDSDDDGEESAKPSARKEFLFSGSGNFVKQWNNFVIIMAIYTSVFIPLQIFYNTNGHAAIRGPTITFIDACVDLLFLIDIIIKFRTTYLDSKQSIEVREPHLIASKYLRGTFFIDFISSVPFSAFLNSGGDSSIRSLFDALGLLKLIRLSRLYTTVQRSNLQREIKVYLKVIMMAILLVIFMHLLSCIWFAVVFEK